MPVGNRQFEGDLYYASSLSETVDWSAMRHIDVDWVEQALAATGAASMRKRRLPAEQVLWLVIGMAMVRSAPLEEVVAQLDLVLPGSGPRPRVAKSTIAQGRARLGEQPLRWLFDKTATKWAHGRARTDQWRGLALYGVDGTTLRVPDSEVNREHFGLANGGDRGMSGYPLVRASALVALRSHLVAAASFGPFSQGEHFYSKSLWDQVPDHSVTVVDRNFAYPKVLLPLSQRGEHRHWLTRARANTKWEVVKRFGAKDVLVRINVNKNARRDNPELPESFECRAIAYSHGDHESSWLLTSLVEHDLYPRVELVELYHERWEHELAYDELKTEMLLSEESLRSKTVEGVRQEIWGILLAYNTIRLEMAAVADEAEISPTRISFAHSLRHMILEWVAYGHASPGALPKRVRRFRQDLKAWILPPRRSDRSYPRAVKRKMSNYRKKRRPGEEHEEEPPK